MAAALLELIDDDERRKRMGRAALDKGSRYGPGRIAGIHSALFQELLDARGDAWGRARRLGRNVGGLAVGVMYGGKDVAKAGIAEPGNRAGKPAE
jgi:hypothetical protein